MAGRQAGKTGEGGLDLKSDLARSAKAGRESGIVAQGHRSPDVRIGTPGLDGIGFE